MEIAVSLWAEAGLPLARTFLAMGQQGFPLAPEQLAQLTGQRVCDVQLQLVDYLCRYAFATHDNDGLFSLTPAGLAKLNGDARPLPKAVRRVRRPPSRPEPPPAGRTRKARRDSSCYPPV